ncbi:hypothetical protein C8Q73DRAFT_642261 [Cubamyces lactineus]|nr:hypothetical protein C8Q73DRAFT_642261 [Cubamyces lactineus]
MLLGIPRSARCVQRFDDSLNSAIHITYRISLRSSSMREPRDPLLKVVLRCVRRDYCYDEPRSVTASDVLGIGPEVSSSSSRVEVQRNRQWITRSS